MFYMEVLISDVFQYLVNLETKNPRHIRGLSIWLRGRNDWLGIGPDRLFGPFGFRQEHKSIVLSDNQSNVEFEMRIPWEFQTRHIRELLFDLKAEKWLTWDWVWQIIRSVWFSTRNVHRSSMEEL